jgi:hypothetical protein
MTDARGDSGDISAAAEAAESALCPDEPGVRKPNCAHTTDGEIDNTDAQRARYHRTKNTRTRGREDQ